MANECQEWLLILCKPNAGVHDLQTFLFILHLPNTESYTLSNWPMAKPECLANQ